MPEVVVHQEFQVAGRVRVGGPDVSTIGDPDVAQCQDPAPVDQPGALERIARHPGPTPGAVEQHLDLAVALAERGQRSGQRVNPNRATLEVDHAQERVHANASGNGTNFTN